MLVNVVRCWQKSRSLANSSKTLCHKRHAMNNIRASSWQLEPGHSTGPATPPLTRRTPPATERWRMPSSPSAFLLWGSPTRGETELSLSPLHWHLLQVAGEPLHPNTRLSLQAPGRHLQPGTLAVHLSPRSPGLQVSYLSHPSNQLTQTPSRPISVLDSVDRIGKEMQVNIINRPYIGSLSNSVGSDIPSEQSGEHFFYI